MQTYTGVIFVIVALSAAVNGRPQGVLFAPHVIPVLSKTHQLDDFGQFSLSYQSGDGTHVQEQGHLKLRSDGRDHILVKKGSYSYISPEGKNVQVSYTADENGFRPISPILPISVAGPIRK